MDFFIAEIKEFFTIKKAVNNSFSLSLSLSLFIYLSIYVKIKSFVVFHLP